MTLMFGIVPTESWRLFYFGFSLRGFFFKITFFFNFRFPVSIKFPCRLCLGCFANYDKDFLGHILCTFAVSHNITDVSFLGSNFEFFVGLCKFRLGLTHHCLKVRFWIFGFFNNF